MAEPRATEADFVEALADYLERPSDRARDRLLRSVQSAPNFRPELNLAAILLPMLDSGDLKTAVRAHSALLPGAFLSPIYHELAGKIARAAGDAEGEARADYFRRMCLRLILDSGEGTLAAPWHVLMTGDEYAVLADQGLVSNEQRLVRTDEGYFDVHTIDQDRIVWFALPAGILGDAQ